MSALTTTDDRAALQAELRRLVAVNQLEEAGDRLTAIARSDAWPEYRRLVLNQSGQLSEYRTLRARGTESPEALIRARNRLSLGLLELIDQLPDGAVEDRPAPAGVAEDRLKRNLTWLLATGKLLVVGFAALLWNTGTFTNEQFISLIGILLPIFAAHLTLLVQDAAARRSQLEVGPARVSRGFARMAYLICVGYALVLLLLLNLRGPGTLTQLQFTSLLALAEAIMGAYLGKVLYGLVKGE